MVWGGATFDMIRRMKAAQRASRSRGRVYADRTLRLREADSHLQRESFDCLHLCGACGYLADAAPEAGCPNCESTAWVDLGQLDAADRVRKAEEEDRRFPVGDAERNAKLAAVGGGVLGGVTLAVLGGIAGVFEWRFAFPVGVALAGTSAFSGYLLLRMRLFEYFHERQGTRPARWRLPLPLRESALTSSERLEGVAAANGPLLTAPISGRECIAYEISVLFDVAGDARRPLWVLEEERSVAWSIDDRMVAADTATLELPLHAIPVDRPRMESDQVREFLRKRGLFSSDGEFTFFEAVVLPGARYALDFDDATEGPVVHQPGTVGTVASTREFPTTDEYAEVREPYEAGGPDPSEVPAPRKPWGWPARVGAALVVFGGFAVVAWPHIPGTAELEVDLRHRYGCGPAPGASLAFLGDSPRTSQIEPPPAPFVGPTDAELAALVSTWPGATVETGGSYYGTKVWLPRAGRGDLIAIWGPEEALGRWRDRWVEADAAASVEDECPALAVSIRRAGNDGLEHLGSDPERPLADFEGRLVGHTVAELGLDPEHVASGRGGLEVDLGSATLRMGISGEIVRSWSMELRCYSGCKDGSQFEQRFAPTVPLGEHEIGPGSRGFRSVARPELRWVDRHVFVGPRP